MNIIFQKAWEKIQIYSNEYGFIIDALFIIYAHQFMFITIYGMSKELVVFPYCLTLLCFYAVLVKYQQKDEQYKLECDAHDKLVELYKKNNKQKSENYDKLYIIAEQLSEQNEKWKALYDKVYNEYYKLYNKSNTSSIKLPDLNKKRDTNKPN